MITIADVQSRAWKNKLHQGFNTEDVPREFALIHGEVSEAFEAYRKNPDALGAELADVVIYAAGIAEMTGVDLDAAVEAKLAVNEARTYERNEGGHLIKTDSGKDHPVNDTKTETPADRMRLAVKRLRCDHTYPIQPPLGSLAHPGPCRHCGMPYPGDDEEVPDALRGALVFLLEEIARQYDMPPCDKPDGCCNGCERRDDFVYANGLAQIINGDKGFAR